MAEVSSAFESGTSNTSSDDMIIKSIQESIDAQVGLVPRDKKDKLELHEVNLSSSFDQIDDLHVEQGLELVQNGGIPVTKFNHSSHIGVIDEGKEEQIVGLRGNSNRNDVKEGRKEKRPRKRGKGLKQNPIPDFERQSVCDCDKRGDRARVVYINEEMEALRYVGIDEQKKKWIEAYCGLGPDASKEYDALIGSAHANQDENYVNFDPRPQFANKMGNNEVQNMNQVEHGVKGSDLDGEEDYYEEEDSDSDHVSIQRPAFMVTGEPDFDSGPPQDGLEYLRRVRWEAEHIPKVKVVKVERSVLIKEQTVYMPNIPDIAACPEHLMPSKEWEDAFLADFSNLRLALSQDETSASVFSEEMESIPVSQSVLDSVIQENLDICHTDDVIQENLDSCQTEDKTVICDWPRLQNIVEMEPVARVIMLRKRIISMESMSSLCRNDCAWLFALCAAIDTPLDADTGASLRCLLRKCAALRAEKLDLDDEVIMLNILATISGKYFGQLESN
ncbi:unnamed protein product [Lactuca saligna]|uniref:Gem-associated protein 2 n=1 Tax=Lactuca saligna TaxID=75948 RepID=A0AA35ZEP5_LACSI|nr:unnamed protein product [Lactuca saligna]